MVFYVIVFLFGEICLIIHQSVCVCVCVCSEQNLFKGIPLHTTLHLKWLIEYPTSWLSWVPRVCILCISLCVLWSNDSVPLTWICSNSCTDAAFLIFIHSRITRQPKAQQLNGLVLQSVFSIPPPCWWSCSAKIWQHQTMNLNPRNFSSLNIDANSVEVRIIKVNCTNRIKMFRSWTVIIDFCNNSVWDCLRYAQAV